LTLQRTANRPTQEEHWNADRIPAHSHKVLISPIQLAFQFKRRLPLRTAVLELAPKQASATVEHNALQVAGLAGTRDGETGRAAGLPTSEHRHRADREDPRLKTMHCYPLNNPEKPTGDCGATSGEERRNEEGKQWLFNHG
jgi:hypothetical protein